MQHNIVFMTLSGPCLVSLCVGKYVDIESDIGERALHESFKNADDVKTFMDKYVSDTTRAGYYPNWYFVNIFVVPSAENGGLLR